MLFLFYTMKYSIALLLLLTMTCSFGQTEVQKLYAKVDSLLAIDQNDEALNEALNLEAKSLVLYGPGSVQLYEAIILKGDCHFALSQFQEAFDTYQRALQKIDQAEGESFNFAYVQHSTAQCLIKLGRPELSIDVFISTGELYQRTIGFENQFYASLLTDLGEVLMDLDEIEAAFTIYEELAPLEEAISENNDFNGKSYLNLAKLAFILGFTETAEEAALIALSYMETNKDGDSEDLVQTILLLGEIYLENGQYYLVPLLMKEGSNLSNQIKSKPFKNEITLTKGLAEFELKNYSQSINDLKAVEGELKGLDALIATYTIAQSQSAIGQKKNARQSMKSVIQMANEIGELDANMIASIYNQTALLDQALANYEDAVKYYEKTLEIIGTRNIQMQLTAMGNLASLYSDLGHFSEAEGIYLQVLDRVENDPSKRNLYIQVLNNLGTLYMDWGDFSKCELLLSESYNETVNYFGANSIEYANSKNNLGSFYFEVGNYDKAVDHFSEALLAYKSLAGQNTIEYSSILNNIGMLFLEVNEFEEAYAYLDSAKQIEKVILGEDHPEYAATLSNISYVQGELGEYDLAEKNIRQAMGIVKSHFTETHPDYALYQLNLGKIFAKKGENQLAKLTLKKSLYLHQELFGAKHPNYAIAQFHLAKLLAREGKLKEALPHFNSYAEILKDHLSDFLPFLSEKEKSSFFRKYTPYFHEYFQFAAKAKDIDPSIQNEAFNLSITLKGILLRSSKAMRNVILNSGNDELISIYDKWVNLKKRISEISALPIEQSGEELAKLNDQANKYEKELYQLSDELNAAALNGGDWKSVKESLKEGEAVIEFINYKNSETDKTEYAAIVLAQNSKQAEIIPLFEETELTDIIGIYGTNNLKYVENVYSFSKEGGTNLYDLIWKPIDDKISHCKRVYISSTGLLHRISLYAVAISEDEYLIDAYELISINSAIDIIDFKDTPSSELENITLMGGIDYDTDNSDKIVWEYLPGSKIEVEAIKKTLKKKNKTINYQTAELATETYFKEISQKSDVFHIATHGFFFPDPKKVWTMFETDDTPSDEVEFRGQSQIVGVTSFTENKNPLMRSGLVFAGVHELWSGHKSIKEDDGVLTALEVSQLNLTNTKLAILSACETGLGEIDGNEGVYGLKRTFKIAGVQNIILSLWQVPDKETMEFMLLFYEELYKDSETTVLEAFETTQKKMRQLYDPYFWAAFVLIQ